MCRTRRIRSEDSPPAYSESRDTTIQEEGDHTIRQLNHANVVRLTRQLDSRFRLGVRVNHADAGVVHKDLDVKLLGADLLDTLSNRVGIGQVD